MTQQSSKRKREVCPSCGSKTGLAHYEVETPHVWCFACEYHAFDDGEQRQLSPQEKAMHDQDRRDRQEATAKQAQALWADAGPVNSNHGYIVRKLAPSAIPAYGARQRDNALLIPAYGQDGKLWTVQRIYPQVLSAGTDKFFLKESRTSHSFMQIGKIDSMPILFCEGWATGCTIHAAMNEAYPVIVCFNADNLSNVLSDFHIKYPDKVKVICADNDQWGEKNTGVTKAMNLQRMYGCKVAIPQFKNVSGKPTDFNDMATMSGLNEVKEQIDAAIREESKPEILTKLPTVTLFSHSANAYRIQHYFNGKLFYALGMGWISWNGKFWRADPTSDCSLTTGLIQELSKYILLESSLVSKKASDESDEERRKSLMSQAENLIKWAAQSENERNIASGLKLAKRALLVEYNDLNPDPWLFNIENGTIDLRTGKLKNHDSKDLITFIAPVNYDASAKCPTWEKFLSEVFEGDTDMVAFMQRAIGWSLTGVVKERALFFLYGDTGKNGKSTMVETITRLLGTCGESSYGYGRKVTADTFMKSKNNDDNQRKAAALAGPRFICTSEVDEAHRLNEQLIKDITGGDTIEGRKLYQEAFTFKPQFKPWMYGNHKPEIQGTDDAIWSRVKLIPFEVSFQGREDIHLTDKLQDELPGILNWAIRGCLDWQQQGLNPPAKVQAATNRYRAEMDAFGQFITECCIADRNAVEKAKDLYEAYKAWAEDNGIRVHSQTKFGNYLTSKRFFSDDKARPKTRHGLRLINEDDSRTVRTVGTVIPETPYKDSSIGDFPDNYANCANCAKTTDTQEHEDFSPAEKPCEINSTAADVEYF